MALDAALLSQLLGPHPAHRMGFDDLRAGLLRGVEANLIHVSRDGDLELFGYSSACQFEQRWDLFSLISRGLILDTAERRVVATPFPKFFNFNEGGVQLPQEPFEVTEKIDGSLGILFHHRGNWRVSTRGQLTSPQGQWATRYLNSHPGAHHLVPGMTYLAEIVYRENQIVIPYDFEGLVLLSAYDERGIELPHQLLQDLAVRADFRIAKAVSCASFDELLVAARQLTRHQEGFVIRFSGGLRVKLKGEAYCRVHKLVCHCTPLALWESMANLEDLDAMRTELPEEMRRDFDTIRRLLQSRLETLVQEVREGHQRLTGQSDKELGLMIQNPAAPITDVQRKFLFACRKQNFLQVVHQKGECREKLFRVMRPDGNRLAGYVPSDAITRFEQEQAL